MKYKFYNQEVKYLAIALRSMKSYYTFSNLSTKPNPTQLVFLVIVFLFFKYISNKGQKNMN